MLSVGRDAEGPRVSGLIGLPEQSRATREFQVVIVNGRTVVSPLLQHAVRMGYGDLIPGDRHPMAVIVIEIDPGLIDANVHPTKREVRFAAEGLVFEAVRGAVREALATLAPNAEPWRRSIEERLPADAREGGWDLVRESWTDQLSLAVAREPLDPAGAASDPLVRERPARVEEPKLWQLHRRYIFAQVGSGLLIIDQHAAHERILYERALARLNGDEPTTQQLLLPKVLELTPSELALLEELGPDLVRLGFEIEPFGGRSIVVRAVPSDIHRTNLDTLLVDLLDEYNQAGRAVRDVRQRLARAFACRAAIKSGTLLGPDEMRALIDALFSTGTPHGDPHGRPTLIQTSLDELDHRFGRS
jgi:DNA mismatch repair protein MutL